MKFQCQHCREIITVSDAELPVRIEKVKEKCQCGMTSEYRMSRIAAFAAVCIIAVLLGSCVVMDYIELQKIKVIDPQNFKIERGREGFDRDKLQVVPREDKK